MLALPLVLPAAINYDLTSSKAERFFKNKEWASAGAMYELMLAERPREASVYAHAIVVAEMMGDDEREMSLLHDAMNHALPFDSVMNSVHSISLAEGCIEAYESFLLHVQKSYPWLSRGIDRYLLEYYTFRCNGPKIVRYSRLLLEGLPGSVAHLTSLARGYMLSNNLPQAMDAYREVLGVDPDNFEALTALGNYAVMRRADGLARDYLSRAYRVKPTPYVAKMLENL